MTVLVGAMATAAERKATERALADIAAAPGPLALDTERAGSFRYSDDACLLQVRTTTGLTVLIDPLATTPETPEGNAFDAALAGALHDRTWILHDAPQDIPCLRELGLAPKAILDTRLAARLLGWRPTSYSAIVSRVLGAQLPTSRGAANWSRRPLPASWIDYAAADVAHLHALTEILAGHLEEAGRDDWYAEECAYLTTTAWSPAPPPDPEPWRRIPGVAALSPRQRAAACELWWARDAVAFDANRAPHLILSNRDLGALAGCVDGESLPTLPPIFARAAREALSRAAALPASECPGPRRSASSGTLHSRPHVWPEELRYRPHRTHPTTSDVRPVANGLLADTAAPLGIDSEVLCTPSLLRDVMWHLPHLPASNRPSSIIALEETIEAMLLRGGARSWQASLLVEPVADTLMSTGWVPLPR